MNQNDFPSGFFVASYIILVWTIIWKGIALWKSAKNGQRNWFIIILVLNPPIFTTLGILELIYLFRFAKKRMKLSDIKDFFQNIFYTKSK